MTSYYRLITLAKATDKGKDSFLQLLGGVDLEGVLKRGAKAEAKMIKYNRKDVLDTDNLWKYASKHFEAKHNRATALGGLFCKQCGSDSIRKNGTRIQGATTYQNFHCKDHHGYAGRATVSKNGSLGKIS